MHHYEGGFFANPANWVLIAFVLFFVLFGRKLWSVLAAMLDDRYRKKDVARYTDRKDAPLDEAVALLVREKLTGEIPPEGARTMVDLWRPWIE